MNTAENNTDKLRTVIIGHGNVGTHLMEALKKEADVILVNSHDLSSIPQNADLIIICVKDNAVKTIADNLPETGAVVAHTSGSVPIDEISYEGKDTGVFYPLQTFTKNIPLNYRDIPVFIEASSERAEKILTETAKLFTEKIYHADSEKRKKLHLASVFACNFTNALAGIAKDILGESGIDMNTILPLMEQTVNKLKILSPEEAQTGPAVRGDSQVIARHLDMLKENKRYSDLYTIFSEIISDNNKKLM